MEILTALEKVQQTTADQNVREAGDLSVGDGVRQGDVYLARIPAKRGKVSSLGAQLVAGTTRGSRHVLEGDFVTYRGEASELPEWVERDRALVALFFRVGDRGARLTHPEHAHVTFAPNTTWGTWQQMDPRTLDRVLD